MPATLASCDLAGPAAILEAVESYRGTIIDLDAGQSLSAADFAAAREALIARLAAAGLQSGDRVVLAVANGPLYIAALTGILALEASPLLVHFKAPMAELHRYARRFGARFLATEVAEASDAGEFLAAETTIPFAANGALRWGRFETADSEPPGPVLRGVPLHPTSGSTGLPKIALRPGPAAMEEAAHYAATMQVTNRDTIVAIPPMSHAYGYGMCVMLPLLTGANLISTRAFSTKSIQRAIQEFSPSIVPTVPAMLDMLALSGVDLSSIRWLLTAGSLLPKPTAEQFRQRTGVTACPLYGTTETGGISVAVAGNGLDVDGRVGPPMRGVEVEIRPSEVAATAGPGVGKVFIRSTSMMAGYLDDQGNVTPVGAGDWFETGDLAQLVDGTINLRGRDSEVINVSGLKVVPCEIEEVIRELPGVREVKVYAQQHRTGGQIVKAAVALDGATCEDDVYAHCQRQLVYYKRPQLVVRVEALPRTPAGKINSALLP